MRTKNSWRKDMKNKFSHNLTKNNSFTYISSKKQFLSYVTGVKIADFYVSLTYEI